MSDGGGGRLPRLPWRQGRRRWEPRQALLIGGEAVELPCKGRRTTSRGWGMWADGRLHLPGPDGGRAAFVVDDPTQVALVTRHGQAPVVLDPPFDVALRPVRYRAEAFPGMAADIVAVTSAQRVLEIALPPGEVAPAVRRLSALG